MQSSTSMRGAVAGERVLASPGTFVRFLGNGLSQQRSQRIVHLIGRFPRPDSTNHYAAIQHRLADASAGLGDFRAAKGPFLGQCENDQNHPVAAKWLRLQETADRQLGCIFCSSLFWGRHRTDESTRSKFHKARCEPDCENMQFIGPLPTRILPALNIRRSMS
jgi:hypothetical protein